MTPQRWEEIKRIFESALELEGDLRAAFLNNAHVADPSLRAEVVELIASHERAGSFMAAAAFQSATHRISDEAVSAQPGWRIGAYRTIREIGRGGMGTVYLAARADDEYRKVVAIKVVKRGMDTEAVIRSFRKERQILASLDHPHIARLLDGGSTQDGLPYFVMEYVEGLPIDEYCDTRRLPIAARLELFRTACLAVQYAHERGVVHRDLKPGNIIVTAAGTPKLLDFGIAKVLDPELWPMTESATLTGPLTPAYASPEQVRGEEITQATDIYSLGVMLYELLAGHRPYGLHSYTPQEFQRVVCEQEPEKPSRIVTRTEEIPVAGDGPLTITAEAVCAARAEQADTLRQQLAGDLDNIVLMALRKEPDRRYITVEQFSDDLRRHLEKLPVIAERNTPSYIAGKFVRRNRVGVTTGVFSVVLLLASIAVWLSADRERLARRGTSNADAWREYVTGRHFSDQRTADGLTAGLAHFERALELDGKYALAYAGLADTYIGFATFRVKSPNEAYVKAKEAAFQALKIDPDVSEAHSALAMVLLYHEWNWDAAEAEFTKAIRLNPEDTAARQRYALALAWFERFDDALREMALAREADPVSPLIRSVGQILYFAGRYEEAIQELDKALVLERNSSLARNLLGITYVATGAFDRAIAEFRSALESGNPEVEANLAHAYAVSGRTDEARKILDQLLASSAHRYVSPFDIAVVYAGLGERDTAFMWLDKAFTERTRTMLSLRVNPRLAPLRSDSRFTTLVRRTKIFDPR